MRRKITKAAVEALQPSTGWLWDTEVKGFGVRRRFNAAVYALKTPINGRDRWMTIGKHGSPWAADMARREAIRLLASVHAGNDVATVRDRKSREPTVGAVLDRYKKEYVAAHNSPSTAKEIDRHIERDIKPALGAIRISDLARADVVAWHAGYADRPYTGNRALSYLRKALSLAAREWGLRPDNPALGVQLFPEVERDKFFSADELARIGKALNELEAEGYSESAIRCTRLLALTGMRLSEVREHEWEWLDLPSNRTLLPDSKAKAGARVVALGDAASIYLESLERIGPYVCYGSDPEAAPMSEGAFYGFWRELKKRAKLKNARPHDFRHSFATLSGASGTAFQVRDLLGHRTLSMTNRYVSRNADPLRSLANTVSDQILSALNR